MAEVSGAPLATAAAALLAVFVWSYWSVFGDLWRVWRDNDNYSSGILVPFIAAYVAYARRKDLAAVERRPWLWGLAIILAGFAMRFAGSILLFASAERLSVVVVVAGLVVTVFGLGVARRAAGVLAFLFLMLPWPNRLYNPASLWLQDWAVGSSVFLLETFGCIVSREGNSVLHVGGATVRIAEACNGLRMLTAFMVVSGFMAFLSGRGFFEKAVIFVSSIPIAVACNTLRLTATAIAFSAGYGERVNRFFHDFGGIAMMPLALAIMAGEVWLVRRLFITDESPNASPRAVSQERAGRAQP
jgi:exosortase